LRLANSGLPQSSVSICCYNCQKINESDSCYEFPDIWLEKLGEFILYPRYYLVALIVQNSNQILIDIKNIYEFKDIIRFSNDRSDIHQKIIDNIPNGIRNYK